MAVRERRPFGPGVVVSYDLPNGSLSFPLRYVLTFDENLRAIGLSLQALRAVDRYGVTKRGEQFTGWKRLPPPSDKPFDSKRTLRSSSYHASLRGARFPLR